MASKSTLDPENFPAGTRRKGKRTGHDIGALGPSDSSDSGSDLAGARPNTDDMSLDRGADEDSDAGHANDIDVDRVVSAGEAGLGGGLDQAEEALVGARGGAEFETPSETRRRRIAVAAYYRAERRGFISGSEDDDWLQAEQEIDAKPDNG